MTAPSSFDLRAALAGGAPLLLDGATGSQLLASGFHAERDFLDVDDGVEVLNLTRPEQVRAVHESWLDAGCDLVTTNTFMALPGVIAECGLADRYVELLHAAVRAARGAADAWSEAGHPRGVLGGLGPGFDRPSASGTPRADVHAEYARAFGLLRAAGVDGLLIETASDPLQVEASLAAAREGYDGPLVLSLLAGAAPLEVAAGLARDHGVDVLAVNCGDGPARAEPALAALRERWDGALGCWPNAGASDPDGPAGPGPIGPEEFADAVAALVRRFDLALVGGCCGTTPPHLRALADRLGRAPQA